MRHRKSTKILSRTAASRKALIKNLATSLVLHGKIRTTETKAKVLRPYVERLVTAAKKGTLADRRQILQKVDTEAAVKVLMDKLGPQFKSRNGGYTRLMKIGPRQGDGAPVVLIEFLS